MDLSTERRKLYQELGDRIGKTPLVAYQGEVPNGNRILIKRECDNPFGSPYDRVYLALFKDFEIRGKIRSGSKVIETTSGAAGVSFAGIGRILGFECYVALPTGGEYARELAIRNQLTKPENLILTPGQNYISGFPEFLREFLPQHKKVVFLNHSMGKRINGEKERGNNEVTLSALEEFMQETLAVTPVDFFISAIGNGSTTLAAARRLPETAKIIAFETFQSAVAYDQIYPGQYKAEFGIEPGTLSRHRLPGTSYQGINFPHIRNAVKEGLIDKAVLVSDACMDEEYEKLTGRRLNRELLHWDGISMNGSNDLGRSTKAGIVVALNEAKSVSDKIFLVVAYDKADRYDS